MAGEEAATANGDQARLKIGIAGAGIAGLTAAITLLRAGHDVDLYEKSQFAKEIGAAIHVTPNSSRVLYSYDFDSVTAQASELTEIAMLDAATMQMQHLMVFPDCRQTYGAPWEFYHRADLHRGLLKMATEQQEGGRPGGRLHLQSNIVDVASDGTITFEDGTTVKKDVVVVANGINSELVAQVAGSPAVNKPTGLAMIRFLIPMAELTSDPSTKDFFNEKLTRFISATSGKNTFVAYPCRGGTMANCCVFHEDKIEWAEHESSRPAAKEDLYAISANFSPILKTVCEKAQELSIWRLRTRPDPVKVLANGRLVLIGDAAHPMLPFLGQGGAMAVEDAGALGTLLDASASSSDVSKRLALFHKLRLNRTTAVQILSNWILHGYEGVIKQAAPYLDGAKIADRNEMNEWCYNYDVQGQAQTLLSTTT